MIDLKEYITRRGSLYGCDIKKFECYKYSDCDICLEDKIKKYTAKVRADAIDEYKKQLWEDVEARYKNNIEIFGYISAENLLKDIRNAICYFAKKLKKEYNNDGR